MSDGELWPVAEVQVLARINPATAPTICGHCDLPIMGSASYNMVPVCHPEPDSGRPDCYVLVSREHHHFSPCHKCLGIEHEGH